jgi:3-oxoadipate enol-lactonase
VKVNNIELNVKILGGGAPFIWGHGLIENMAFEDRSVWIEWKRFGDVIRLVRYDARGYGLSEASYAPEDYHWSNLAKDMLAIADQLHFKTFIAGGKSMGCGTSLYAALCAPKRVRALVLVNPPAAWEMRAAQTSIYDQMAELVEAKGVAPLAELMQQRRMFPDWLLQAKPEVMTVYLKAVQSHSARTLAQALRGAKLCDFPAREELKALKMPALILAWVGDATHPLATAEELGRLLPDSELFVAKDLGDMKTWTRLIREFVMSLP